MRPSLQTVGLVRSPREYVPSVECFPRTKCVASVAALLHVPPRLPSSEIFSVHAQSHS
jgi:hypothetical protein